MLLSFINRNRKSVTLPQGDSLILQDWSGFAGNNVDLITNKAPDQIGTTIIKKIYNARALSIQFTIKESNRQSVFDKRREIISIFNGAGTLIWQQNDGTIYQISAEVENLEMPSGDARSNTFQTVQVDFLAEDPLWTRENPIIENLSIGSSSGFINDGDIRTPIIIRISGPIDNPAVKNLNTGAKMKLNGSFDEVDTIVFNTEFGNKHVYVESVSGRKYNAMSLLDLDSKMFYLEPGNNSISVTGLNTITGITSAEIEFYERFLGV